MIPGTYGLVLCGGNSSRMGTDKSRLTYFEKPQCYHVFEMLQPFCEKVFISCKDEQVASIADGFNFISDDAAYNDIGPMAAVLTAFTHFPNKNLLIVGCDYPFLTANDLSQFSGYCRGENLAVSFYNEVEGLYEPLLAWYPYSSFEKLMQMHAVKQFSLQHFLNSSSAVKFYTKNKECLLSIDTQEGFLSFLK